MVTLTVRPHFSSSFEREIDFYVMQKLTRTLPDDEFNINDWNHIRGLQLADPKFNKVGPIDVLLGADVVADIMKDGLIKGETGQAMAQSTEFGWIVSGKIDLTYQKNRFNCMVATVEYDQTDLRKFWELEDLNPKRALTADEEACEQHYQDNVQRNPDGTFTVRIPFKSDENGPEKLGTSRNQCLARFMHLERKLGQNPTLKYEYVRVMKEYINMGHLKLVSDQPHQCKKYYIPHHAVIKPDSLTTKTRVVFDASAKTSSGISLNETMHIGAKQQKDLFETLIKWRSYKIAFKADITKMYRMIKIDENDQQFHTIFWREAPTDELLEYQLTTVTFGTATAPFLAMRTLKELAMVEEKHYPIASTIVQNDFYVDDLISGCNTVEEAIEAKTEVLKLMASGGFELRKWSSNSKELLSSLDPELTEKSLQTFENDDMTKALGLQWNPQTDQFNFRISWNIEDGKMTKRKVFSEASKIFDPLGWLAPTIINAKLFMQEIWANKTNWDEEVPVAIQEKWTQFREELPLLEQIKVPRWINFGTQSTVQLHGFCDSSEKAYSAVVYTRIQNEDQVEIRLIASKTRVAPINLKTTLPRLELCGAVLLSNLLVTTAESLDMKDAPIIAWSDSMIALGWLKGAPSKWKTFVANRVAEIQSTKITDWRHIRSAENPADCASRGMMPNELKNFKLWWEGPAWLKNDPDTWPTSEVTEDNGDDTERRAMVVNVTTVTTNDYVENVSSWFKIIRLTAYCLRMKKRVPRSSAITTEEIKKATEALIKRCQRKSFPDEIDKLSKNKPVLKSSRLLQLDPFLDQSGIMRVGGRLQQAQIAYENRHPAILHPDHKITTMIIQQMHTDTLHGGAQMMLGLLKKKYWILNAKRKVTGMVRKCVTCTRMSKRTLPQQMGVLPKHRVSLVRPFLFCGVDYCGPFEIKSSTLRKAKIHKAYIAIFVCFGTKAFHLEMVSDQTAEAFLATFNRFVARRGLCDTIYSDNGGNFQKGASLLEKQQKTWLLQRNEEMKVLLSQKGIKWRFNPPESPNHGGLWERGVKSVKHHLHRTLQTARLTFEEYTTVLCQIEACLNSRPLCPLTNEIDNLNVLTPGHFLIGDALMAAPQPILEESIYNKVNRWHHLQLLQQHFWNRWHKEYLSQLQQRQKWTTGEENLKVEDVVLLKDEDLPPRNWLMGRVEELFPGKDGKVRVVSVRTHSNGDPRTRKIIILKRSVRNVCRLVSREFSTDKQASTTEKSSDINQRMSVQPKQVQPKNNQSGIQVKRALQKFSRPKEPQTKQPKKAHTRLVTNDPTRKIGKVTKKAVPAVHQNKYNLRSRKVNLATFMMLILAAILGGCLADHNPVNNMAFENNSGLYFEDLGRAQVIQSKWHIYIHFGLAKYFKRLQEMTQDFRNASTNIDDDIYSHDIATILTEKLADIKNLNVLIKSNNEVHSETELRISKRAAPLSVVGWIQHQLFGVMAADQAEHIENQIELAKDNRQHLLELVKNQTTVVENTVNLVKMSHDDINKNYEKIDSILTKMQQETSHTEKKEMVMGLALYTTLLVNRFEKIQQNILDLLTDVQKGHISSRIFTPQQLREQLVIINNNLPSGSRLFEDGQHDIKSIYKMMHCTTRVTNKNLLVHITIPLVSMEDYQAYHVIPVPTKYQGEYVSIIPESDYLMITLKKDNFYQLSDNEWNTCAKPGSKAVMCELKHPRYNDQSGKSQCERELLKQKTEFSSTCKFNVTKKYDFWFQLQRKNHWIYSLEKSIQLNIVCGQQLHTIKLNNAGIIELGPGCEAMHEGMTITARYDKISEGNYSLIPTLDLSKTLVKSKEEQKLQLVNTTIDHADQFNLIHDQLQELNAQSRLNEIRHSTHHGINITMLITVTAVALVIWFKRNWLIAKFTQENNTPTSATGDHSEQRKANKEDGRSKKPLSDDIEISVATSRLRSSTVGKRHGGENVQPNIEDIC